VHYCVYQRLWFLARDMSQCRNELIEVRIHARAHYKFYSGFWLATVCHALADLLVCSLDKLAGTVSSVGAMAQISLTELNRWCKAYSPTVFIS
jgi:hypothetical protein